MRIVYVCNEYPPRPHGGIGTFYKRCAEAMAHAGHDVTVVGIGDATAKFDDCGVRVHTLKRYPIRALCQFGNRRRVYQWLLQRASQGQIDLVEIPDFQGYLPYPLPGCGVVVRLHLSETIIAADNGGRARPLFRRFERQTLSRHRHWIGCSHDVLQRTITAFGIRPEKFAVIPSLRTNTPPGTTPDWLPEKYILFAGALSRRKGALLLAEAASEFLGRHPGLHLIYAGPAVKDGTRPTDDIIREIIGADRLSHVHFTGRIPNGDVLALMQHARAFVFPSVLEAFPLVVTEAMAMRCPVVTLAVPPFTEFITDNETGLLVEPHAAAITQAIDNLMQNPEKRRAIGEAARQKINALCSEETFIRSTIGFYKSIQSVPAGGTGPKTRARHKSAPTGATGL